MGWHSRGRKFHPWQHRHHGLARAIRRRLFWRFYVTLIVSLLVMVLIGGFVWHRVAQMPLPPGYSLDTKLIEALLPPAEAGDGAAAEALRRLSAKLGGQLRLTQRDGRIIAEAGFRGERHDDDEEGIADLRMPHGRSFRTFRVDLADGRILMARGLPRFSDEPPPAFLYLFAVAAAIGLAAYPLVGRITRRLEGLRQVVEVWGNGRLDARAPERGEDEIAAVARSFNRAATQVEGLISAHRSLLAHASHELRSPLARLRMAVEFYEASPTEAIKRSIEADIAELDALVEEILLASRLDHVGDRMERESVDMLALAAEEAARIGATLTEPPVGLVSSLSGSPRLLRRLIRNLLENARKHGAPPIELGLSPIPWSKPVGTLAGGQTASPSGGLRLVVRDHGAGIPAAERERVFEPFYRPAGHAESSGSWGLGLALVRKIAESHGGRVTCEAATDGGACFIVDLPTT